MFIVYILYSKKLNRYYTGYTNNLDRRISEHNRKKGKYTDMGIPWEVLYTEECYRMGFELILRKGEKKTD